MIHITFFVLMNQMFGLEMFIFLKCKMILWSSIMGYTQQKISSAMQLSTIFYSDVSPIYRFEIDYSKIGDKKDENSGNKKDS